jgi:hypothetical protein
MQAGGIELSQQVSEHTAEEDLPHLGGDGLGELRRSLRMLLAEPIEACGG